LLLPLPRFATARWFFMLLAGVHLYLGGGHLLPLFGGELAWTHAWKGFGAAFGAYYFLALGLRERSDPP
jgi:hypothetical protein